MDNTWWLNLNQLDDDQKRVIATPLNQDQLVLGPPGSGKSNLLLLRADFIQRAGNPNSVILVFTKQLQKFMRGGAGNYSFSPDKIKTSQTWAMELLKSYDALPELDDDFPQKRIKIFQALTTLIKKNHLSGLFEYILLDEVQDYLPEEIDSFLAVTKYIFAVGDSNQKIYDGVDGLSYLEKKVANVFKLYHHYRNGLNICKLADGIAKQTCDYKPLATTSNYNESVAPSSVSVLKCKNTEDFFDTIPKKITNQLKAYPGEFIGILTPCKEELRSIADFMKSTSFYQQGMVQLPDENNNTIDATRPIIVSTMHSSKGLEFRVLHLCFLENLKKFGKNRNISFTGVTRAKTALYIYHIDGMLGYFEQALANLKRPPELPTLDALFVKENK